MIIANPIYDVVFKRLMENDRIARFFIGTLLGETVSSVNIKPQEFTYVTDEVKLSVFRLDFIATILTANGPKKVLIEIQKARNHVDLMRFRNYLAEQYRKEDQIGEDSMVLPITTIYVLGFQLPEINAACIKVAHTYLDLAKGEMIPSKSYFIERLVHDTFIIQASRIKGPIRTPLDELLSIFEQTNFMDTISITKRYDHKPQSEDAQLMVEILRVIALDPAEQKQADDEKEAWRTFDALSGGMLTRARKSYKQMQDMENVLEEKTSELQEKESELQEKESELQKKTSEMQKIESELERRNKLIEELQNRLNEK